MVNFRTKVKIQESKDKFGYNSKAIMLGSCFVENIGEKLFGYKFDCNVNPFGVIYNPISVGESLVSHIIVVFHMPMQMNVCI